MTSQVIVLSTLLCVSVFEKLILIHDVSIILQRASSDRVRSTVNNVYNREADVLSRIENTLHEENSLQVFETSDFRRQVTRPNRTKLNMLTPAAEVYE